MGKIRLKLKAYDHRVLDRSVASIVGAIVNYSTSKNDNHTDHLQLEQNLGYTNISGKLETYCHDPN